jgi:hypothetical protein
MLAVVAFISNCSGDCATRLAHAVVPVCQPNQFRCVPAVECAVCCVGEGGGGHRKSAGAYNTCWAAAGTSGVAVYSMSAFARWHAPYSFSWSMAGAAVEWAGCYMCSDAARMWRCADSIIGPEYTHPLGPLPPHSSRR